jgi:hypothetical protein
LQWGTPSRSHAPFMCASSSSPASLRIFAGEGDHARRGPHKIASRFCGVPCMVEGGRRLELPDCIRNRNRFAYISRVRARIALVSLRVGPATAFGGPRQRATLPTERIGLAERFRLFARQRAASRIQAHAAAKGRHHRSAASVAPRMAPGFCAVPLWIRTATASTPVDLIASIGALSVSASPAQVPSLTQPRTTLV